VPLKPGHIIQAVWNQWTRLLDWTTGLDYWTGLLDWNTGLEYWTGILDWNTGLEYWNGLNCCKKPYLDMTTFWKVVTHSVTSLKCSMPCLDILPQSLGD